MAQNNFEVTAGGVVLVLTLLSIAADLILSKRSKVARESRTSRVQVGKY